MFCTAVALMRDNHDSRMRHSNASSMSGQAMFVDCFLIELPENFCIIQSAVAIFNYKTVSFDNRI